MEGAAPEALISLRNFSEAYIPASVTSYISNQSRMWNKYLLKYDQWTDSKLEKDRLNDNNIII